MSKTQADQGLRAVTTKNPRGTIGIETKGNRYRLRLPRSVAVDSSRYISTGLEVTPENLRAVRRIVLTIEEDIAQGTLDRSLEKYRPRPALGVAKITPNQAALVDLWDAYSAFKRSSLAETTYSSDYCKKYRNRLLKLPTQDPRQAVKIRAYLVENYSHDAAKRTLEYLSACLGWALTSGLVDHNPFEGLAVDLRRRQKPREEIDPFTVQEREAILEGFRTHLHHYHWVPFVRFLFLTGCRPGEAVALTWREIDQEDRWIWFRYSFDQKLKIIKSTKTEETRRFPVNGQLGDLLKELRPEDWDPEDLIFTAPQGGRVNVSRFSSQVWKGCRSGAKVYRGVLPDLIESGQVARYRPPYNARHTWITMMLEGGVSIPRVAKLAGNSPEVILKHYAGVLDGIALPEI